MFYEPFKVDVSKGWPIDVSTAKYYLRGFEGITSEDANIQSLIKTATYFCENYIGKTITETTFVAYFNNFQGNCLQLNTGSFNEIVSVVTDASVNVTVSKVKKYPNYTIIEFSTSVSSDPLYVSYKTGTSDCLEIYKQSILMKVRNLYDDNDDDTAIYRLLDSYKQINW